MTNKHWLTKNGIFNPIRHKLWLCSSTRNNINLTRTVSHRLTNTPHPSMSRLFALELGRTKLFLPTLTHQGEITPVRVMWPVPNSQRRKFTTWPLISESLKKICLITTKMNPGQKTKLCFGGYNQKKHAFFKWSWNHCSKWRFCS